MLLSAGGFWAEDMCFVPVCSGACVIMFLWVACVWIDKLGLWLLLWLLYVPVLFLLLLLLFCCPLQSGTMVVLWDVFNIDPSDFEMLLHEVVVPLFC